MFQTNVVRIPKNRIGVLIGVKGKAKQELEHLFSCILKIDSKTGEVTVLLPTSSNDPVLALKAIAAVKAIGRGFSPEQGKLLQKEGVHLEIIRLREYIGTSKKGMKRIRSRLIGSEGKTRKLIEEYTKTSIVIEGNTVSIIGKYDTLLDARQAIIKLINGTQQNSVYSWLEERRKERRRNKDDQTWDTEKANLMSLEEFDKWLKQDKQREDLDLEEEFEKIIKKEESKN